MLKKVLIFSFLLSCAFHAKVSAQNTNFRFKNLAHTDFQLAGAVTSIAQDNLGFIWIGGENALLRYDGYEVITYYSQKDQSGGISNSYIRKILLDSQDRLWVATNSGLNRFDYQREEFEQFLHDENDPESISHNEITGIAEDQDGNIWISTGSGLDRFDDTTNSFIHHSLNIFNENGQATQKLSSVIVTKNNWIWASAWGGGAYKVNPETGEYIHFMPNNNDDHSITNNSTWGVFERRDGSVWVALQDGGLDRFNETTQGFDHFKHNPNDDSTISNARVASMVEDHDGNFWIATDGAGLNLFRDEDESFIRFDEKHAPLHGMNNNKVRSAFVDNTGGIWLGHFPSGISVVDRYASGFKNYSDKSLPALSHKAVLALDEDKNGDIWIGTEKGLNRLNRKENHVTYYSSKSGQDNDYKTSNYLHADPVISVLADSHGHVWAGTWLGSVSKLNPQTGKFQHYLYDRPGGVCTDIVWSLYEDRDGVVWAGCANSWLSYYDRESDSFVTEPPLTKHNPAPGSVMVMYEDRLGNFWLGLETGLLLYDRSTKNYKAYLSDESDPHSLSSSSITVIHEDNREDLWIATSDGGINRFDRKTERFTPFDKTKGLANDSVVGIVEDNNGHLWLGTGNGISKLDIVSGVFKTFREEHGIAGNLHNRHAYIKTHDGEVIFGSTNGLSVFKPDNLNYNLTAPDVFLTEFKLFNKPVVPRDEHQLFDSSISITNRLALNYSHYVFSFKFSALNYRVPEMNQYAYMLQGFDKDWVYVKNKRTATYTNIDPGEYTFRVKASNNEGIWNEEGVKLALTVSPPWWYTWWAYSLYVLATLFVFSSIIYRQFRKRRIAEEQKEILEIKVQERTAEISQKSDEIQAMLSNMRQGLFTVERGGCIQHEYSQHLEKIFETKNIAERDAVDFLFYNSDIGADAINSVRSAISTIIGEGEVNFEFNMHLLVTQINVSINNNCKILDIDWSPIIKDDKVEKIMVTVRDVTQLREMEAAKLRKQRELDIIIELLDVNHQNYRTFIENTRSLITDNEKTIENTDSVSNEIITILLRNMHTIKGVGRAFNFTHICDEAHKIEDFYADLKQIPQEKRAEKADKQNLLSQLQTIRTVIAEYDNVYHDLLNRYENTEKASGVWLDTKLLDKIQQDFTALPSSVPTLRSNKTFAQISTYLDQLLSSSLTSTLSELVNSLPAVAEQLGKLPPHIEIVDNNVQIKKNAETLVINIFSHLLRNSIDHGIETPEERTRAGKNPRGEIQIIAHIEAQDEEAPRATIRIADDGKGLNIGKLFSRGMELGFWSYNQKPSLEQVANVIFESGVSMKESVNDISGRGVGMNAVRQFIQENGGDIKLHLLTEQDLEASYLQFEILLYLPPSCFTVISEP